MSDADPTNVLNCTANHLPQLKLILAKYGLTHVAVAADQPIPGSFFGEREAGLITNQLYIRHDTPIHSALHEACHYICMTPSRRQTLDTDAEGDFAEENGVCYLQILLAEQISSMGKRRMMADMDSWGYSFRLGSAQAWFENDADDAIEWLQHYAIIDSLRHPTWQLRMHY